MSQLIFIEGVSGVGKSTMVKMLSDELSARGLNVKEYIEFDFTNPIDFYCTAYLPCKEYEELCSTYKVAADSIRRYTVCAGSAKMVRYYNEDTPLFENPLLSELAQYEFCYHPKHLVSLHQYTSACVQVWKNYSSTIDEKYDYVIFDGSLLHHPINDMIRNYHITDGQAVAHITDLLGALGSLERRIAYLKSNDIGKQLKKAHIDRGEHTPTDEQVSFWTTRYEYDMVVLRSLKENCQIYDVSNNAWDTARKKILDSIL